jgi:hypothetical protein
LKWRKGQPSVGHKLRAIRINGAIFRNFNIKVRNKMLFGKILRLVRTFRLKQLRRLKNEYESAKFGARRKEGRKEEGRKEGRKEGSLRPR